MIFYEVTSQPTIDKINGYDNDNNIFYRFQMKDLEMGSRSWLMMYSSEDEAIECCKYDGLTRDEAVLNGKSACSTAKELMSYVYFFDKDFRVMVLSGHRIGTGHDGESVVDVNKVIEIWDFDAFTVLMSKSKDYALGI